MDKYRVGGVCVCWMGNGKTHQLPRLKQIWLAFNGRTTWQYDWLMGLMGGHIGRRKGRADMLDSCADYIIVVYGNGKKISIVLIDA